MSPGADRVRTVKPTSATSTGSRTSALATGVAPKKALALATRSASAPLPAAPTVVTGSNGTPPPGSGSMLSPMDAPMCSTATTCVGQQGPAGAQGPAGPQGPAGKDGADVCPAPLARPGQRGPRALSDPWGRWASEDPQGCPAPTARAAQRARPGPQGSIGPAGPQGPKGDTGAAGPAGAQSPAGPQGPAGAQGAAGKNGGGTTISRSTTYAVTATYTPTGTAARVVAAQCANYNDIVLSGGCNVANGIPLVLTSFGPELDGTTSGGSVVLPNQAWRCVYSTTTGSNAPITATALCLAIP
jgi:hypothetical protein